MMKNPAHPGILLKHDVLEPLGLGVKDAAKRLSLSRVALSRVLNGHAAISPDLAIRLERAGVSTARFWMALQSNHDLYRASQKGQPEIQALQDNAA